MCDIFRPAKGACGMRDTTLKCGTIPHNAGHLVTLPIYEGLMDFL